MRIKEKNRMFNLIQMSFLWSVFLFGIGNVNAIEETIEELSPNKGSLHTQANLKDGGESDTDSTGSLSLRSSEEYRKSLEADVGGEMDASLQQGLGQPHVDQTIQNNDAQKIDKKLTLKERFQERSKRIKAKNQAEREQSYKEHREYVKQVHDAFENAEVIAIRHDENGYEIGRTLRVAPGSLPPSRLKHPEYLK